MGNLQPQWKRAEGNEKERKKSMKDMRLLRKRTISVALSAAMVISMVPTGFTLAAEQDAANTRFDQPQRLFESFKRGKGFFRFAHYYYVISAKEDIPLNRGKAGYFGQELALYLTSLRLGCCWEISRLQICTG